MRDDPSTTPDDREVTTRGYADDDLADLQRVWQEVGWVDEGEESDALEGFLAGATVRVAELDGAAECQASIHRGSLRHTGTDLDAAVVSAVTTSRVGRRRGLARRVLAEALAAAADDGAAVAVLGMFEQGFYDTLGFGTGAEHLLHRLDPDSLDRDLPWRTPVRLGLDDHADVAACLAARRRGHGGVAIPDAAMRRAELVWSTPGFGLGYRDADGTLTHFLWCRSKGEHGPYRVVSWAWQDVAQLRELLGLLRSFGDQVRTVVVPEPAELQLFALTDRPGRQEVARTQGEHAYRVTADTWWQARVLDLPACVAALRTCGPTVELVLDVADPVDRWADPAGWRGVGGRWHVALRPEGSTATRLDADEADGLPVLRCGVGSLTRLWLGVRSPSVLAATDGLQAGEGLLGDLDAALAHLPRPDPGMDF